MGAPCFDPLSLHTHTMADCSDPQIADGYQAVRSDADDTNWFVCGYESNTKIVFQAKGSDGFSGFVNALDDSQCQYGFVRFITGDEESKRAKFAFIRGAARRPRPWPAPRCRCTRPR